MLKLVEFGQLFFLSMKPNWLLRFHRYHTFGDYLNSHSAILVIANLCLSSYCNETNLPWGNWTWSQRVLPIATRESCTHTTVKSPSQLSNSQAQHPNQISKTLDIHNFPTWAEIFKTINQIYNWTWYLIITSFHNVIASSYGKLKQCEKILTKRPKF